MGFFANNQIRTALVIAPLLGLGTYLAVDHLVSERPQAAKAGLSYPLAEKSNCRYASGVCTLKNGDIELKVRPHRIDATSVELEVKSELQIERLWVASGSGEQFAEPVSFTKSSQNSFRARVPVSSPKTTRFRWAMTIATARYFAETSAAFVDPPPQPGNQNVVAPSIP